MCFQSLCPRAVCNVSKLEISKSHLPHSNSWHVLLGHLPGVGKCGDANMAQGNEVQGHQRLWERANSGTWSSTATEVRPSAYAKPSKPFAQQGYLTLAETHTTVVSSTQLTATLVICAQHWEIHHAQPWIYSAFICSLVQGSWKSTERCLLGFGGLQIRSTMCNFVWDT